MGGLIKNLNKSLTNFLVNSPSRIVFLKSVDTSDVIKDAQKLFELVDSLVEKIGEETVAQVVTDSASAYVTAGELLMKKRKSYFGLLTQLIALTICWRMCVNCQYSRILLKKLEKFVFIFINMLGYLVCIANSPRKER